MLLLGIYLKNAPLYQRNTCTAMFIPALLVISKDWKSPRCSSTEEWIKKRSYIYAVEYYSAIKNEDVIKFAGKLKKKLENMILSEITQRQNNTYDIYSL